MTADERVAELRRVELVADLPDERLRWIADHVTDIDLAAGDELWQNGDEPRAFYFLLDGRLETINSDNGSETVVVDHRPYTFLGAIPLLAGTPYPGTSRALQPTRVLELGKDDFFDLVRDEESVRQGVLRTFRPVFERFGRVQAQREKMAALGSLSAGLAHELNNPAAAAGRAAEELGEALGAVQDGLGRLAAHGVAGETLAALAETAARARAVAAQAEDEDLDALERSDREEELARALDEHGVPDAWDLAPDLVEAGIDVSCTAAVAGKVGPDAAADALVWVAAGARAETLARSLTEATSRIAELVGAVKEYTYMDRAPTTDVDVHRGIKTTFTVLKHKLKKGDVKVVKEMSPDLPLIHGSGSELNQVWTNLIDNAIDAIDGNGTITVRTCMDGPDHVLVEIQDDGPGIPEDQQSRIFEPFYTTKDVGSGTGLGLDVTWRIVQGHRGELRVRSRPGETRFSVRLPVQPDADSGSNGSR